MLFKLVLPAFVQCLKTKKVTVSLVVFSVATLVKVILKKAIVVVQIAIVAVKLRKNRPVSRETKSIVIDRFHKKLKSITNDHIKIFLF